LAEKEKIIDPIKILDKFIELNPLGKVSKISGLQEIAIQGIKNQAGHVENLFRRVDQSYG